MKKMIVASQALVAAIAAVVFAATAPPAPAHADNLGAYLQQLDSTGIDYHDPQSAVNMGNAVCNSLEAFANPTQIEGAIIAAMYSPRAAKGIVHASIEKLCPEEAHTWNSWIATYQGDSPEPPTGDGAEVAVHQLQRAAEAAYEP